MKFTEYRVTWTELRETEVFAKSEDDAIAEAKHMNGNVLQKYIYSAEEIEQ